MSWSAARAVIEHCKLSGLQNKHFFVMAGKAGMSRIEVPADLMSDLNDGNLAACVRGREARGEAGGEGKAVIASSCIPKPPLQIASHCRLGLE